MSFSLSHESGVIDKAELHSALDVLDAYLIRRAVCNLKNNALDSS